MGHKEIENLLENFREVWKRSGFRLSPSNVSEILSVEIADENYNCLKKLNELIERFDKNSSRYSKWMFTISIIMTILIVVQIIIMIIQISNSN